MWLVSAELPRAAIPMIPMPAATTPAAPTGVRILVLIPRSPHQAVRLLGDVSIGVRGAAVMAVLQEWNGMRGEWGLRRAEWTELSRSDTWWRWDTGKLRHSRPGPSRIAACRE